MNFVLQQLLELLAITGVGMLCAGLYKGYELLRRWLKPRLWLSNVCDFLFWLGLAVLVFGLLLLINYGAVRFYVFLGLILGAILYFKGIGRFLENIITIKGKPNKFSAASRHTGKNSR